MHMRKAFVIFLLLSISVTGFLTVCADGGVESKRVLSDEEFLDLVQQKALQFFIQESNKKTGLVKDRANNSRDANSRVASIAAVGFALPAYVIGAQRGWITEQEAYERVLNTLQYFRDSLENENGFYYHFIDINTRKRAGDSELSSIDTALFFGGVLFVRQYYKGTEIEAVATELYERVNWQWMLNDAGVFSMGWRPTRHGGQFLDSCWGGYCESMLLYILGIGSPTYPVPASVWHNIVRPIERYGEHVLIYSPQLFTHQYSHIFIDFRNKHDQYADYFVNSRAATLANREFCIDNKDLYDTYSENVWGLTACDGPGGYRAYGAKPGHAQHDGTVAPTAAGGSIVFTPEFSIPALRYMYDTYKDRLWGRYGFSDAFNLEKNWFASDVIGIDQGAILLMIENYRSGLVWEFMMRDEDVQRAMSAIGFQEGSKALSMPQAVEVKIKRRPREISVDGNLGEWKRVEPIPFGEPEHVEYGNIENEQDFNVDLYFVWDLTFLYVAAKITDNDVSFRRGRAAIYKNDCLELFIDPEGDGLEWDNPDDIQLGLSPQFGDPHKRGKAWAWFQDMDPIEKKAVYLASAATEDGYILEAAIRWSFIGIKPDYTKQLHVSPAVHDFDEHDKSQAKINLFFQDLTGKDDRKKLAIFTLIDS